MDSTDEIAKKHSGWWGRRTALEKSLIFLILAVLTAVIALVIELTYVMIVNTKLEENQKTLTKTTLAPTRTTACPTAEPKIKNDSCLTNECIQTAAMVLQGIDFSVQPCDDFYSFACGTFVKNSYIPLDRNRVNTFTITKDKLSEQLRNLVSEEPHEDDPRSLKLVNDLFRACMNQALIEERGKKPMMDIIESIGGWPVLKEDNWNEDSWTWQGAVKNFNRFGLGDDYIIAFNVEIDIKNSTKRIISLDQSKTVLGVKYLVEGPDNEIVQEYYNYMVDVAVIYGANRERAERELNASLAFEIELAKISLPYEKRHINDILYNSITINETQNKYPYVNWLDYINTILPEGLNVDENEEIIIWIPSFLESLGPLLEQTPKRVIANYMMWSAAIRASLFLTDELRTRQLEYNKALHGVKEEKSRWKECTEFTSRNLDVAVGALYVRKYFHEVDKNSAVEIVHEILKKFQKVVKEIDWMDDYTRQLAINKLKNIVKHIGYPDELIDNSKIEEFYKHLEIDKTKYLESVMNITKWNKIMSYNKLRMPVNKTDWIDHADPIDVEAKFSSFENSILIPAGILQGKFFSAARPKYMNYGTIGCITGHEITRGFHDHGRQFHINGKSAAWWEESTREAFYKKAECIIEQYGNFTDEATGMMLNGTNTLDANIADNGGAKIAYLAYKQWVQKNGPELKLPGIQFSPEQLFWISAAQTLCSNYRQELLKLKIQVGVEPPAHFRVQGTLENSEHFAKDFNCPKGTPMNPNHKCVVW